MENDILYARLVELANQKPLPQHQATACLVTPILVKGSLPRHRYARMIISPSKHPSATNAINPCPCPGEECVSEGTIGGGNAELMAHSAALEVVSSGIPQKQVFKYDTPEDVKQGDKTPKGAIETGAVCGGAMTVLFEPVGLRSERVAKPQREIFAETLKSLKAGQRVVEWVEVGPEPWTRAQAPRRWVAVAASAVTPTGPRPFEVYPAAGPNHHHQPQGAVEKTLTEASMEIYSKVRQTIIHHHHPGSGRTVELAAYPLLPAPTVFIFGGGHVGKEVATVARVANFRVVVIDDRPEFVAKERHPTAEHVVCAGGGDWASAFAALNIDLHAYIVILTHGHLGDIDCLKEALKTPAKYIGCIGSRRKFAYVAHELQQCGFSERDVARIHHPIGLSIGGDTPGEIAVSIVAEMVQTRYHAKGKHGERTAAQAGRTGEKALAPAVEEEGAGLASADEKQRSAKRQKTGQ